MKKFACGDVVPSCQQTFLAADDDVLLGLVAVHARDDHGLTEVPVELAGAVRAAIRTV